MVSLLVRSKSCYLLKDRRCCLFEVSWKTPKGAWRKTLREFGLNAHTESGKWAWISCIKEVVDPSHSLQYRPSGNFFFRIGWKGYLSQTQKDAQEMIWWIPFSIILCSHFPSSSISLWMSQGRTFVKQHIKTAYHCLWIDVSFNFAPFSGMASKVFGIDGHDQVQRRLANQFFIPSTSYVTKEEIEKNIDFSQFCCFELSSINIQGKRTLQSSFIDIIWFFFNLMSSVHQGLRENYNPSDSRLMIQCNVNAAGLPRHSTLEYFQESRKKKGKRKTMKEEGRKKTDERGRKIKKAVTVTGFFFFLFSDLGWSGENSRGMPLRRTAFFTYHRLDEKNTSADRLDVRYYFVRLWTQDQWYCLFRPEFGG